MRSGLRAIRGFGVPTVYWLIDHGYLISGTDEDDDWFDPADMMLDPVRGDPIEKVFVDSDFRPGKPEAGSVHTVYDFCRRYPSIATPFKGRNTTREALCRPGCVHVIEHLDSLIVGRQGRPRLFAGSGDMNVRWEAAGVVQRADPHEADVLPWAIHMALAPDGDLATWAACNRPAWPLGDGMVGSTISRESSAPRSASIEALGSTGVPVWRWHHRH